LKDDTRPNLVFTGNRQDGLFGSNSSQMLRFLGRYAENIVQVVALDAACRRYADEFWGFQ